MVSKLLKYDFQSYLRLLLPVQLILPGVALIGRLIQLFEPSSDAQKAVNSVYQGIFTSSIVLLYIAIVVCFVMTVVVSVVRFYQGMYTNEGYLNHTLPVTPTEHIVAKLLNSMIFYFGSFLAVFLSFIIITFGELNIELFKAGFYLLGRFIREHGTQGVLVIIESIILLILIAIHTFLKLYCCISVGQLAKKRKVLLAFGVYFGLYIANQIVGTILIVIAVINTDLVYKVMSWMTERPSVALLIIILYLTVVSVIYFVVNNLIMSKKLNLT